MLEPTFNSDDLSIPSLTSSPPPLFPCSPSPAQRRPSHHKKRPPSHIPRPPNAFILFRANFIRDRHLHTTSEGPLSNVSPTALSTIVGITWRNLPEEERQVWVEKARIAREEHKILHPTYRYQPLPTAEERALNRENKRKVKEENIVKPDLERCQAISQFLVKGLRGQELEERVAQFDRERDPSLRSPMSGVTANHPHRSASLPTPLRRRNTRRPRSYSTSTSPPAVRSVVCESHSLPSDSPFLRSPELHPGQVYGDPAVLQNIDSALPDLTYDPASPSSINLPELQETSYIASSSSVDGSTYHSHLPFSPPGHPHSLLTTPPITASATDPFSSFSSWNNVHPTSEQYYQFSYFNGTNDQMIAPDTHLAHTSANIVDPHFTDFRRRQAHITLTTTNIHAMTPNFNAYHRRQ